MRRDLEVMRVLRVPPLGKLVVEVNGQRYESLAEINDDKVRRILLAAIGELIDFAGRYDALVEAGVASPQGGTGQLPSLEQQQEEFLARLEAEREAVLQAQAAKSSYRALSEEQIGWTGLPEPPNKQDLSVAEQIDLILQKHLLADSEMAKRSIHLVEESVGEIGIEVDGRVYQKPSDIPEPSVQELIKRAVKEWDGP
jgi:hypothetical protein